MTINLDESSAERRIMHTDDDCYDVMYWSIRLGVSIERLLDAITKMGPLVMNVERYLSASTAVMTDPSAPNPGRGMAQSHGLCAAGLANGSIVQPDPTVFLVRNDNPGEVRWPPGS